jgi:hypothetical protein
MPRSLAKNSGAIPTTLLRPGALRFWLAVCLIGTSTGLAAAALTRLLEVVQRVAWRGSGTNLLAAARQASGSRHLVTLLAAGILTGVGQFILKELSSGNGIDTTAAIWFYAGRMPALRTLGSALLSIFAVGMGASMAGRVHPSRLALSSLISSLMPKTFPMSSEGCWWLVALEPVWEHLWRSTGRRAFRARSDAREAGLAVCSAAPLTPKTGDLGIRSSVHAIPKLDHGQPGGLSRLVDPHNSRSNLTLSGVRSRRS